ncbi:MAG TPA: hypothetical protein VK165_02010 [Azonexus sp.]|nr:hypothetical protein [Azonexus sp.]
MAKKQELFDPWSLLPIEWIRAERYSQLTGETMEAIYSHIREGDWASSKHYKRTGQRTLWINIREAQEWIRKQPHVETVVNAGRKTT